MKPTDMRRLSALVKDEHMASKEYAQMAKDFKAEGYGRFGEMFEEMSSDEARHKKNILNLINFLKE